MSNNDSTQVKLLSSVLQKASGVHLDESQSQQLDQVLKSLPAKSGLSELDAALVGCEPLAAFRTALQEAREQGRYGALFDGADNAENVLGQATTHVFLKETQ